MTITKYEKNFKYPTFSIIYHVNIHPYAYPVSIQFVLALLASSRHLRIHTMKITILAFSDIKVHLSPQRTQKYLCLVVGEGGN